jgi:ankyrin repeat protein
MITRKTLGKVLVLALVLTLSLIGCKSGGGGGGGSSAYDGMSPEGKFVSAAVYGDLETIQELLASGVDINALGAIRRPALTLASYNGHMDIVKLLVEKGADIDMVSGNGEDTALIMAVKLKEAEIATYLVESGANVNIEDAEGKTALNYAQETGQAGIVSLLESKGAIAGAGLSDE